MRISDWSSDVCSSDLLFPIVVKHCDRIPVQAGAAPLSGALAAQRFIDGDAGKPGGQRRASLEPFDRSKSAQICALHRILGFRAIAEDGEGGSKQALVVARGNVPHRSRIARGDKRRQSCVIQRTVVVIAMYHGDHSYSPVLASHWRSEEHTSGLQSLMRI